MNWVALLHLDQFFRLVSVQVAAFEASVGLDGTAFR